VLSERTKSAQQKQWIFREEYGALTILVFTVDINALLYMHVAHEFHPGPKACRQALGPGWPLEAKHGN